MMVANKKVAARPLDGAGGHGYDSRPMRRIFTFAVFFLLVAGCQSNQSTQVLSPEKFVTATGGGAYSNAETNATVATNAKPRVIVPGVTISVTVDEDHSLNRAYLIPNSGAIDYPPLGRLVVEGLTPEELAQKIRESLEKDYFQKATVMVAVESSPIAGGAGGGGVIYVIGNVNRPGPLLLPKDEKFTVTKAIIAAGNFATFANGGKVQLIRYNEAGKKYVTYIDVDRIMKRGEFEKDLQVQSGDWIIVPEKLINF
jgi:protein involved in polysaccharide export with SLBB domain